MSRNIIINWKIKFPSCIINILYSDKINSVQSSQMWRIVYCCFKKDSRWDEADRKSSWISVPVETMKLAGFERRQQLDFFVVRSFAQHFLEALETYVSQSCSCSLYRRAGRSGVCRAAVCRRRPGRPDRRPLAACHSRTGSTGHSCARGGSTASLFRRIAFSVMTRTL